MSIPDRGRDGASRSSRRTSPRPSRQAGTPKRTSVFDRLDPGEAQAVLQRLLATRADLRDEAERIARALLGEVSFESVADDVEHALRSLDLDDLGGRAGRHRGGYTSPTEAAWELLQEAVDPFMEDMKRQMELGLGAEALEICKGILLGLYRIRGLKGDEFLGWAPDFPTEAAAHAAATWGARGEQKGAKRRRPRKRPVFPQEFVNEQVPEWGDLIARALERP